MKIAKNVASLLPNGYETGFVEIGNLALLYSEEYDGNSSEKYARFCSLPYCENVWDGKRTAIIIQLISNTSFMLITKISKHARDSTVKKFDGFYLSLLKITIIYQRY